MHTCDARRTTAGASRHGRGAHSAPYALVVVDASYPMGPVWDQVPARLRDLAGARYTVYALATDKGPVHGWQAGLDLGGVRPYGPRQLGDLTRRLPTTWQAEATGGWLITNAGPDEVPAGLDLEVLTVGR